MPVKRKCWFFTDCTRKNVMMVRHNSKSDTFFVHFYALHSKITENICIEKGAQCEM